MATDIRKSTVSFEYRNKFVLTREICSAGYKSSKGQKENLEHDLYVPVVTYFSYNDGYLPGTSGEINFARVKDNADGRQNRYSPRQRECLPPR